MPGGQEGCMQVGCLMQFDHDKKLPCPQLNTICLSLMGMISKLIFPGHFQMS